MQRRIVSAALAAALFSPLPSPLFAQDSPAAGLALAPLPVAPPTNPDGPFGLTVFGVARTLASGEVVTFDGLTVRRVQADGTPVATLGALGVPSFTGCIAIDPTETFAIVGESSMGDVYRVELDGGGMTFLANLPYNYDAAFDPSGDLYVSANVSLSFSDNNVMRVDPTSGAMTSVAFVTGASGPLAFDALGHLYYGLQGSPASILVFTSAQLASGIEQTELDAIVLATGFAGPSSLAVDHVTGAVYLAENDFGTGANRIVRVQGSAALSSEIVVGTTAFNNLSGLELVPSECGGIFAPWQPECGGVLRYTGTDFFSTNDRIAVVPARPQATLTGPGAGPGPGAVTLELSQAPAVGFVQAFFGPTSSFSTPEVAYALAGAPPLFTGLSLSSIDVLGGVIALDAAGELDLPAYDPGLDGVLTVQALCFDAAGMLVGTTTPAHL